MARQMIERIFPSTVNLTEGFLPGLMDHLLPLETGKLCPTPQMAADVPLIYTGEVNWPWLVPVCINGIVCGFGGGAVLLSRGMPSPTGTFSWGMSFMWFGVMNLVAMGLHCFVSHDSELWGSCIGDQLWEELYACDIAFTCNSALCAIAGCIADIGLFNDTNQEAHGILLGACVLVLFAA
eukprot:7262144-Pyramimonas_sp.AAC.1